MNAARGEVIAVLGGERRRLCLTLGALAEMETALDCAGVGPLAERLKRPSAGDLLLVLRALLRGGGEHQAAETLERSDVTLPEAAEAVTAAFRAAAA